METVLKGVFYSTTHKPRTTQIIFFSFWIFQFRGDEKLDRKHVRARCPGTFYSTWIRRNYFSVKVEFARDFNLILGRGKGSEFSPFVNVYDMVWSYLVWGYDLDIEVVRTFLKQKIWPRTLQSHQVPHGIICRFFAFRSESTTTTTANEQGTIGSEINTIVIHLECILRTVDNKLAFSFFSFFNPFFCGGVREHHQV